MKLNVIILNWNAGGDTVRCVAQFSTWKQIQPIIWVVDNASEDNSVIEIQKVLPADRLIHNSENLGFAGGTNRGLKAALACNCSPILLLNNDAYLSEEAAISLLSQLMRIPEVGIIGPLLYTNETPRLLISAGSRNPVLHVQNLIKCFPPKRPLKVDYVSGSVALIKPEVLIRCGLLDERYFFTGEVADLCRRARKEGFQTLVDTQAEAVHALERSQAYRSTLYTYYIVRNRFLYIYKFYRVMLLPLLLFWSAYSILLSVKLRATGNRPSAAAVFLGCADGIRRRFGGQNERILGACSRA